VEGVLVEGVLVEGVLVEVQNVETNPHVCCDQANMHWEWYKKEKSRLK